MEPDALGFFYPKVNPSDCVNCGICVKRCPFIFPKKDESFHQQFFGLRHKSSEELLKSQSGAAFVILSDEILKRGGVVYGAGFSDDYYVLHKRASTVTERDDLRYSKYTQSDINTSLISIIRDLESGNDVLFTGTPCQVAAVNAFVPQNLLSRLYLVDLICHGVPSPFIWRDYIKYIKEKYGDIRVARFRDKRLGWNTHKEFFLCDKERFFITFKALFHRNVCLRSSCYKCPFASIKRISDLTIGDFWGWDQKFKQEQIFIDNKGVSLLLVNTKKGKTLFDDAKSEHINFEVSKEDCLQPNLQAPTSYNPARKNFEEDYKTKGFIYVAKIYSDLGFKTQLKYKVRPILSMLRKFLQI